MPYTLEVSEEEIRQMLKSGINVNEIDKNGYNLFHLAVINNITDVIKLLLNKDIIIDKKAEDGSTALHIAIKLKQKEIINLLLKNGANVNAEHKYGRSSLHLAVFSCYFGKIFTNFEENVLPTAKLSNFDKLISKKQPEFYNHQSTFSYKSPLRDGYLHENLDIIKLLVMHGADINAKGIEYRSSFNWAVRLGLNQTIEFFLKNGANANEMYHDGYFPIYDAVRDNDMEMMNLILNYVPKPDVLDIGGNTPLFYAMKFGFEDIIKLLLQKGAQINNPAAPLLHKALRANDTKMIQLLFKYGADANMKDCAPPLDYAMRLGLGHKSGVYLLKQEAKINALGKYGRTPLIEAVECRNADMVLLLLDHGADVNASDKTNATPLHYATKLKLKYIVELLLDNGAWIDACDQKGHTPLNEAVKINDSEMVSLLLKHGADINGRDDSGANVPLHHAIMKSNSYVVELLLENGARIDELKKSQSDDVCNALSEDYHLEMANVLMKYWTKDPQDNSLLYLAIKSGNFVIVKLLLKNGARVNRFEDEELSLLHEAMQSHKEETVELLLDYGADINALDFYGDTPLSYAIKRYYQTFVKLLLSRNADVNRRDNKGRTPLFTAATGNVESMIWLLEKGADVNVEDNDGMSPFDLATIYVERMLTKRLAMIDPSKLCAGNVRALKSKSEDIQILYNEGRLEIEKMKTCKLGYKTTLYDVFKYDRLLSYDALNRFIESVIQENHFSCYSQQLFEVYHNCFTLRRMYDDAESKLDFFWNHFKLPQLVIQKIMNFFKFKDFRQLLWEKEDILVYNLMSTEC